MKRDISSEEKIYHSVKYEVIGNNFEAGFTDQNNRVSKVKVMDKFKWDSTLRVIGTDFAYVTARNVNGSHKLTVNIYIDGNLFKSVTSFGESATATERVANYYLYYRW